MSAGHLRGHLLTPLAGGGFRFERDAVVAWDDDGRLSSFGKTVGPPVDLGAEGELLLVPGFVDAHVHLPQFRVRGRFQAALLPWLREHIWPEEARCADLPYLRDVARGFRDGCLAAGTTSALVWGSPHAHSAAVVLDEIGPLYTRGGDVLMDRNGPASLLRPVRTGLADARAGAARWGERYAVTPRFPPTNEWDALVGCARISAETGAWFQSHLAENREEVLWVRALFPRAPTYLSVFDQCGALGPRTVLAHGIHLDGADVARIVETGTAIVHCPTSNEALGSGRMPLESWLAAGMKLALGSDVGAGPKLSLLDVIACGRRIHRAHLDLPPTAWLRLATTDGAAVLGEGARRGTLEAGKLADIAVLRLPTPLARGATGDDAFDAVLRGFADRWEEAVAATFCAGVRWNSAGP